MLFAARIETYSGLSVFFGMLLLYLTRRVRNVGLVDVKTDVALMLKLLLLMF